MESAHKLEEAVEQTVRALETAHRSRQLKPYRNADRAEARADSANLDALQKQAQQQNPELQSNPYSRWQQKRAIKKEYAAAKAGGGTVSASEVTAKAAKRAAEDTKKASEWIVEHKKGVLLVLGIAVMIVLLLCTVSSCSMMIQGSATSINVSTYPSEDGDMLAAEAQYCAMEAELQSKLDNYEATHDYDEYHFDLDEIGHDPYVLISALTAIKGREWTLAEVTGTLQMLFDRQYILTETVETEIRYRTEVRTDRDGNRYTVQVPYEYTICTVTLENFDLSHVPVYVMSEDQLALYAMYKLKQVERGELDADAFLGGITAMLTELTRSYRIVPGAEVLFPSGREVIGRCPRCGSDVTESKKGFFCERSDCKFGLWRDNKFLTAKRITLDKQMVAALLARGRVHVDDIYSEKTGKRFSTDLLLEDDGVRSSYRFDFGKEGTK